MVQINVIWKLKVEATLCRVQGYTIETLHQYLFGFCTNRFLYIIISLTPQLLDFFEIHPGTNHKDCKDFPLHVSLITSTIIVCHPKTHFRHSNLIFFISN